MNDRWLLIEMLVKIEIVETNLDFIDCLNASLQQKSTVTHRAAYAKCGCGVAPHKVETGHYLGQPLDARICPFCPNHIEDEFPSQNGNMARW